MFYWSLCFSVLFFSILKKKEFLTSESSLDKFPLSSANCTSFEKFLQGLAQGPLDGSSDGWRVKRYSALHPFLKNCLLRASLGWSLGRDLNVLPIILLKFLFLHMLYFDCPKIQLCFHQNYIFLNSPVVGHFLLRAQPLSLGWWQSCLWKRLHVSC